MQQTIEAVKEDRGIIGFPLEPFRMLYHWSPAERHEQISERGLRIRQLSPHAPIKYPMICFCLDPLLAWDMSGGTFDLPITSWDLWGVEVGDVPGFEVIPTDDRHIREIRVYTSIAPLFVQYIATRISR